MGDCRFVATNRRNISLDMEFLTPPSGVCILIYSRSYRTNRHQPFCGSLGTQSSECGARTGHSRKNQKSGCLASPCRHARKATVFANFGDSWLASSSCTQAWAAEDAVPFSQCECFRLWGANRQVLIDVV